MKSGLVGMELGPSLVSVKSEPAKLLSSPGPDCWERSEALPWRVVEGWDESLAAEGFLWLNACWRLSLRSGFSFGPPSVALLEKERLELLSLLIVSNILSAMSSEMMGEGPPFREEAREMLDGPCFSLEERRVRREEKERERERE